MDTLFYSLMFYWTIRPILITEFTVNIFSIMLLPTEKGSSCVEYSHQHRLNAGKLMCSLYLQCKVEVIQVGCSR